MSAEPSAALRALPSVDQLLRRLADRAEVGQVARARLTALVRETLDAERRRVLVEGAAPAATRRDRRTRRAQTRRRRRARTYLWWSIPR